jgi:hypothetical protein
MERCSICLEVIQSESEAFVENCFHRFCFQVMWRTVLMTRMKRYLSCLNDSLTDS